MKTRTEVIHGQQVTVKVYKENKKKRKQTPIRVPNPRTSIQDLYSLTLWRKEDDKKSAIKIIDA